MAETIVQDNSKADSAKAKSGHAVVKIIGFILLRIILLLVIVLIFYLAIAKSYDFGRAVFSGDAQSTSAGRDVIFAVQEGESVESIVNSLIDNGLITDKYVFYAQIWFYDKTMQPGEYTLNTSMSSKEILMELNEGPSEDDN